jgi:MYXO-CTERM domain-containing protein
MAELAAPKARRGQDEVSVTSPGTSETGGAYWGFLAMVGIGLVWRRRR